LNKFSNRQGEIIDAALGIIAEGGIQSLTIKNLSRVVGISEPALYRHFANKWDILRGIIQYYDRENKEALKSIVDSEKNPLLQLETFYHTLFAQFAHKPALSITLLFNEMFQNDKNLIRRISNIMSRTQAHIMKIITEGQEQRVIRGDISARSLSTMLIGAVRLVITRWRLENFGFDLEKEGSDLWRELKTLIET
jgi:AcrR family transcriptional regulator